MKSLAKALIETAAFLELSGDDAISPGDAVRALESIATTLQSTSPEEIAAIRVTFDELITAERAGLGRADVLTFYEQFLESCGLADDGLRT